MNEMLNSEFIFSYIQNIQADVFKVTTPQLSPAAVDFFIFLLRQFSIVMQNKCVL